MVVFDEKVFMQLAATRELLVRGRTNPVTPIKHVQYRLPNNSSPLGVRFRDKHFQMS